jgi:hypothetical protein
MACFVVCGEILPDRCNQCQPPVGTSMSTDSEIDLDLRAVEISAGDFRRLRDRGGDRHKPRDRALPLFSGWPRRRGWLGSLILRTEPDQGADC